jgi:hypothetical protein
LKISGLTSLRSLNIDNRQITDNALAALISMFIILVGHLMTFFNKKNNLWPSFKPTYFYFFQSPSQAIGSTFNYL